MTKKNSISNLEPRMTLFQFQRLVKWMCDEKRKPAQIEFTAGSARDAGRAFEAYLRVIGNRNSK